MEQVLEVLIKNIVATCPEIDQGLVAVYEGHGRVLITTCVIKNKKRNDRWFELINGKAIEISSPEKALHDAVFIGGKAFRMKQMKEFR